jgi:hypothetical protein
LVSRPDGAVAAPPGTRSWDSESVGQSRRLRRTRCLSARRIWKVCVRSVISSAIESTSARSTSPSSPSRSAVGHPMSTRVFWGRSNEVGTHWLRRRQPGVVRRAASLVGRAGCRRWYRLWRDPPGKGPPTLACGRQGSPPGDQCAVLTTRCQLAKRTMGMSRSDVRDMNCVRSSSFSRPGPAK